MGLLWTMVGSGGSILSGGFFWAVVGGDGFFSVVVGGCRFILDSGG